MFVHVCWWSSQTQTGWNSSSAESSLICIISFISPETSAACGFPHSELWCVLKWKWRSEKNRELILGVNLLGGIFQSRAARLLSRWLPAVWPVGLGFCATPREQPSAQLYFSRYESNTNPPSHTQNWPNSICVRLLTFLSWHISYIRFKSMYYLLLEQMDSVCKVLWFCTESVKTIFN